MYIYIYITKVTTFIYKNSEQKKTKTKAQIKREHLNI